MRISIGALSRATGVPAATIRTWEARYGFPAPQRKASGHRTYAVADIPRLRRMAELTARGVRIGDAVLASEEQLRELLALEEAAGGEGAAGPAPAGEPSTPGLLECVHRFDGQCLARELTLAWGRRGALGFVRDYVAPLVHAVGEAWASGTLGIRHEHFVSERLQDVLRLLRLPLDERADGPRVVLGTPPGEPHTLGLHMVALLLNSAGCRVVMLGAELPAPEMAAIAREQRAAAVGVSVSEANGGPAMAGRLQALRGLLPGGIALVAGGAGAPASAVPSVRSIATLDEADEWALATARGRLR